MVWPFGLDFVHGSLFPLNDPAWSLFFELFVNIFFFYFVVKFKKFYNTFFVITFLLFYIFTTLITKQINPGWSYDYMYSGFIRVIYAFFMGTLIYNYHSQKIYNFSVIVPIIMFIAFFSSSSKVAFFNSIVIAPLSVYFLSQLTHKHGIKSKICSILGDISYPIYILHFPIYRLLHPILSLYISTQATIITIASIFTFILSFISLRIDNSLRLYLKRFTSPATCSLNQTVK
ncbi:Acyltransferase family [Chromobacterium violaceum]|uniref:Acyltransferase family n=1 Tax=Chromobacterium violaceum TaxID=536 RepID=A0AAX2MGJ1_CHRVL|nr:hypothetical protein BS642_13900 [Chromobacterium violaceum]SUY93455.1 Acyltransferase family [Chromobacterium violaceum]